ncbi:YesL family protein [Paenibacillus sp. DS2015]|uniref:YesL family protein n=1 Tax=Paenibacillus sp. DS2015 TaxID=3373917 RepID=UPI003D1A6783
MEFKGTMGGIYRITEWITRIAYSNILWLLFSSPFLVALFMKIMLINVEANANDHLIINWTMGILAPFTLFPAISALFAVVRKWVMGDSDVPVFKTFFRGYRDNYKQSMVGGIFYTLLFIIMWVDYKVYMTEFKNLQLVGGVMLLLLIILFVSMFNFFSMVVHYHMGILLIIKNAILLTLIRPFRMIATVLGSGLLLYIGFSYPALVFFFIVSLIALWSFFNFYGSFLKMQDQAERLKLLEEEKQAALDEKVVEVGIEQK